MANGGLYSGFEAHRILKSEDISEALRTGMLALDTNVLLNLYRYTDKTVEDILEVVSVVGDRLFVPHQVVREFWRNRQAVVSSLGSTSKEARELLQKNSRASSSAITNWAKSVALSPAVRDEMLKSVDDFYEGIVERIEEAPAKITPATPTADDHLLQRMEEILSDRVGLPLDEDDWNGAVAEGEGRVDSQTPPGYLDVDKRNSGLPEGAAGDYLVWSQLTTEGAVRGLDLVLVTSDVKDDWWNRAARGQIVGPRIELIDEYFQATGRRFFLLEPADLLKHASALDVLTDPESVQDVERVRDEWAKAAPWTRESVEVVIDELSAQGYSQADVIAEAIENGGRVSRERVYDLDGREETQMLRAYTRPVTRVTAELQELGDVPYGVPALLRAGYEHGVKSSHFYVPAEVVELMSVVDGE